MKVFVLDSNKHPCHPVHPAKARLFLAEGKAAVFRQYPFTIILKGTGVTQPNPLRLKIDPGSKTTGMAVIDDQYGEIVFAMELNHRGQHIKKALESRRAIRRSRRRRQTARLSSSFQSGLSC